MKASFFAALVALFAATATAGCAPIVGDACTTQSDCGQRLYCELAMPDGYCTSRGCATNPCPAEGICIEFNPDLSYCMQPCDADGDCRSGYTCVKDFGAYPFCNDKRGVAPTVDSAN